MSSDTYDDYSGTSSVPSSFERIIGYNVYDSADQHVGKVHNLWIDDTAQPLFLGVKTGWLFGKNHVVPIGKAEVNDHREQVRLPFTEEQIKNAPTFEENADISDYDQDRIFSYYGVERSVGISTSSEESVTPAQRQEPPVSVRQETMEASPSQKLEQDRTIQLKEEQVKVGKREVESGGIRLRKIVRTETVNQPVELQREEIVIERVPGNQGTAKNEGFGEEDIYIPLRREEAVVQKDARVAEEVHVGKKREIERQQVTEQVRREELEVDDSTRSKNL